MQKTNIEIVEKLNNGKIIVKDITGKKDDNIQLGIKLAESILEV